MSLASLSQSYSRQSTASKQDVREVIESSRSLSAVDEDVDLYPKLEPEAIPIILKKVIHPLSLEGMMHSTPLKVIEAKPRTNFWLST